MHFFWQWRFHEKNKKASVEDLGNIVAMLIITDMNDCINLIIKKLFEQPTEIAYDSVIHTVEYLAETIIEKNTGKKISKTLKKLLTGELRTFQTCKNPAVMITIESPTEKSESIYMDEEIEEEIKEEFDGSKFVQYQMNIHL